VAECWRVMQCLLDNPPEVHAHAKGSWGPASAERVPAGFWNWHELWAAS
jgi:glucose-6-phosphate 1-dehydrogenase